MAVTSKRNITKEFPFHLLLSFYARVRRVSFSDIYVFPIYHTTSMYIQRARINRAYPKRARGDARCIYNIFCASGSSLRCPREYRVTRQNWSRIVDRCLSSLRHMNKSHRRSASTGNSEKRERGESTRGLHEWFIGKMRWCQLITDSRERIFPSPKSALYMISVKYIEFYEYIEF